MNIYIYVKEEFKQTEEKGFTLESILNNYYRIDKKKQSIFKDLKEEEILEHYKKRISENVLKKIAKKEREELGLKLNAEVVDIQLVLAKKGKFVPGSYYAHEYDKTVHGKGRKISYSNGFEEFEIRCLDKELSVADGIWESIDGNGCGDKFYPIERVK
jgi:hypothetical protein